MDYYISLVIITNLFPSYTAFFITFLLSFRVEDAKLSCFEIRTSTERFIFGSKSQEECREWMKEIGLSLNCTLMQGISDYQRISWLYVREGPVN